MVINYDMAKTIEGKRLIHILSRPTYVINTVLK